jgi:hypothetical protein
MINLWLALTSETLIVDFDLVRHLLLISFLVPPYTSETLMVDYFDW